MDEEVMARLRQEFLAAHENLVTARVEVSESRHHVRINKLMTAERMFIAASERMAIAMLMEGGA